MDRKQAHNSIAGLAIDNSIQFVIEELDGNFDPQAIAETMMARIKSRLQFKCKRENGICTVTRLADLPRPQVRRGRPPVYVFSGIEPGESRTLAGLTHSQRPAARHALSMHEVRTGQQFKTSELSGELVITRVDGTPDADTGPRFPFRDTAPGAHFDVASSPDVSVQQVRALAIYHGKVMGCRFSVVANDLGGCRVTRVEERPPGRAHQAIRIRPIPPAPPSLPQKRIAFDTEEF